MTATQPPQGTTTTIEWLFQNSRDPEVGALPPYARMTDAQKALLADKAVAWLSAWKKPLNLMRG